MQWLEKIYFYINRFFLILGGIALLAMMAVATLNVFLRFNKIPFSGAYELVGFLSALAIAFTLGETQRCKDHIMVDLFTRNFSPTLLKWMDGLKSFLAMAFFSLLAYQLVKYGQTIQQSGELSETLKMIYHPYIYCVALGFALLSLTLLIDTIHILLKTEP